MLMPFMVSDLCLGQSSKCKKEQRARTPKVGNSNVCFCPMRSIYLLKFMLIPLMGSDLCPGQSSK
jgi:hypothetical protein